MDFSASHAGFVIASYALTIVFVGGLIISVLMRDHKMRAEAERLDKQRKQVKL